MFLKILEKSTAAIEPDKVALLNPKDRLKLEHGTAVQFLPWVPKKLYVCKRTTTSGVSVTDLLKFVIDEGKDYVEWSWKSTTHKQVYYSHSVEPCKPIQLPNSMELVYLPTGEIVKSTDMCDGVHVICHDIHGNRWLINCTLLAEHKASEPSQITQFKVGALYTSSGHVFRVTERGVTYMSVKDLCGGKVNLFVNSGDSEEFAEFPDGARVFARSRVKGFA